MKSKLIWALSGLIFLGGVNVPVKNYDNVVIEQVYQKKSKTLDSMLANFDDVSVSVYSVDDGKFVYEYNSDQDIIPASSVKLFTAAVALKKLGEDYKFETEFYTNGGIEKGVLKGDLFVKGYGNPVLTDNELEEIVQDLKDKGITKIEGDIIGDASFFDGKLTPGNLENMHSYDHYEAYNARTSGLSYNWNAIKFIFKSDGKNISIYPEQETEYIEGIGNKIKIRSYTNIRPKTIVSKDRECFLFEGGMKKNSRTAFYVNVENPAAYFVKSFKSILELEGIDVLGDAHEGSLDGSLNLLYTHQSEPLSEIVNKMCKFSNNFIAEQLVKTLGAKFGSSGSLEEGTKIIKSYANSIGLYPHIVDGSGLSTLNSISSKDFVNLLIEVSKDPAIYGSFVDALPVSYTDGTLKRRMKTMKGKVKAKTGSMGFKGVSSLSGYMEAKDGKEYVFSIIINDCSRSVYYMKAIETRLLKEFYS